MLDQIVDDARQLSPVSSAAAEQYAARRQTLTDDVNRRLKAHPEIDRLTGGQRGMMFDNHANHSMFMANVFKLGRLDVMARVAAWAYRAYWLHGFDFDYFRAELEAWKQAIREHVDEDAADELCGVYDWMLDHHDQFTQAARSNSMSSVPAEEVWHPQAEPFLNALLAGKHREFLRLIDETVDSADDLPALYMDVIQPAMYRIGTLWESGELSVAREHLSTSIVSRAMASLYERLAQIEPTRGKALVTAAPNEHHELGARMVADLLELDGWDVTYLGANSPIETVPEQAAEEDADLVAISTAMPFNLEGTLELIRAVRGHPKLEGTGVIVGGLAYRALPGLEELMDADGYAENAAEAMETARNFD